VVKDLLPVDIPCNEIKPLTVAPVNMCGLTVAKEAFGAQFPRLYSSRLALNPRTGEAPKRHHCARYPVAEADFIFRFCAFLATPSKPFPFSCKLCPHKPEFTGIDGLRGHMVLGQRFLVPTSQSASSAKFSQLIAKPWDVTTASVSTCFISAYLKTCRGTLSTPTSLMHGLDVLRDRIEGASPGLWADVILRGRDVLPLHRSS
jgi:hypothetical protein